MKSALPKKSYTASEVAELDRYAIEDLGVDLMQLMEIAGLRSAEAATVLFDRSTTIAILAGPGGNGGDALVCAKWLYLWGWNVSIHLSHSEDRLRDITMHQLALCRSFFITMSDSLPKNPGGIVDGLLGYSLEGNPRGKSADMITWANNSGAPVLALDIPSGLNATTGVASIPCISAVHTVVYGVLKKGLDSDEGKKHAGTIELVDIVFPREFPKNIL